MRRGLIILGVGELVFVVWLAAMPNPANIKIGLINGAIGLLMLRASLAHLETTSDAVVVKNVFRTRSFPWEQVDGFTIGSWFPLTAWMVFVSLTDGTRVHVYGIQGPGRSHPWRQPVAHLMADKLNELRQSMPRARGAPLSE